MRRLFTILVLVSSTMLSACGGASDPPDTGPDAPRWADPFACGAMTCDPTQICHYEGSGVDAGMGPLPPTCEDRPAACSAAMDCSFASCAIEESCIRAVCGGVSDCHRIEGDGRVVACCRA